MLLALVLSLAGCKRWDNQMEAGRQEMLAQVTACPAPAKCTAVGGFPTLAQVQRVNVGMYRSFEPSQRCGPWDLATPQDPLHGAAAACYEDWNDTMNRSAQEFEITPDEAVGAVRFGMPASQVRAQFGSATMPTHRSLPYDVFGEFGIRVHYRPQDGVEAIEFQGPACPTLHGRRLLRQRYGDLEQWISTLDPNVKLEHSGLTSNLLGVRLYATSARRNPDAPVEVVTVFDKDYRQRYMESIVPPPR